MYHTALPYYCTILVYHGTVPYLCTILVYHTTIPYWCTILLYHTTITYWCIMVLYHTGVPYWCTILLYHIQLHNNLVAFVNWLIVHSAILVDSVIFVIFQSDFSTIFGVWDDGNFIDSIIKCTYLIKIGPIITCLELVWNHSCKFNNQAKIKIIWIIIFPADQRHLDDKITFIFRDN